MKYKVGDKVKIKIKDYCGDREKEVINRLPDRVATIKFTYP